MISPRRKMRAHGTSAASRRRSHVAVGSFARYSAILLMRAAALRKRADRHVAVLGLEHQIGPVVRVGGGGFRTSAEPVPGPYSRDQRRWSHRT